MSIYVTLLHLHYFHISTLQLPTTAAVHSAVSGTPYSAYLNGGSESNSIELFTMELQFVSIISMSR